MRLLLIGDADSVHLQRWVAEMARRGARCHVLTRRPAPVRGANEVLAIRPGNDTAGWFLALPAVRAAARRIAPDLVHGHYITSSGLWAAACGRSPVVMTAWGSDLLLTPRHSRFKRALTGWILRRADLLTGDSADLLAAMDGYGAKAPRHEIGWGADCDLFVPPPSRDLCSLRLVSLRAWDSNYRIDTLLEAVARFRQREPKAGVTLSLLGGGPLEAALRAQAATLGLTGGDAPVVRFVGRADDAGMVAALQAAQVSISVPQSDATSVSLLESMSCGLAVVASDLPANRQWVDAAGGLLVPAGDAEALARALQSLWRDRAALPAMGAHNREVVLQRASRRQHMDRMFALYQSILAASQRAGGPSGPGSGQGA